VAEGRPLRVAAVGVSTTDPCGVRDHATLLARGLVGEGIECSLLWLEREGEQSPRRGIAALRSWSEGLGAELGRGGFEAVLWHYSVFSYAWRGIPLAVPTVLGALRETRLPLVGMLHEYAYPWRRGGLRGKAWSISQRLALIELMRACRAVVVSDPERREWLARRPWLVRRPIGVAPVFSNLPCAGHPPGGEPELAGGEPRIGLFGYSHEAIEVELTLAAMAELERRGIAARLLLAGAPGRDSAAGRRWLGAAGELGLAREPAFTGVLPAGELAAALAACTVLVCVERPGPTPRKTTLAASLSCGRPVVAIDGRLSWPELVRAGAALMVEPRAGALADALAGLLGDRRARAEQGERGRRFAAANMSVEHSAEVVAGMLRASLGCGRASAAGEPRLRASLG